MDRKEIRRTPLVMMPDGKFLRGDEFVSEGVVVEEPPSMRNHQSLKTKQQRIRKMSKNV